MIQNSINTNLEKENKFLKEQVEQLKAEIATLKNDKKESTNTYAEAEYQLPQSLQDVVYRLNLPGCKYSFISPQITDLTGYTPNELYANPNLVRKIIHHDHIASFIAAWKKLIDGIIPDAYEYKIVKKNGQVRWIHQKNLIIKGENNKPIAVEGLVTDITEKKNAELSLIKSEAQIKAILNNLPHLAWLKDTEGVYQAVNLPFALSVGANSVDELIGKTDYELYEPEIAQKYRDQDLKVLIQKQQAYFEEKSETQFFETFKAPIFDNICNLIGITGISLEISKRKFAEEEIKDYSEKLTMHNAKLKIINDELKKAKEKAEESDKLKSAFLANMSHEIRTPMNAILGFATLLKNRKLPEEKRNNFIDLINANCRQLLRIITDIIDISKIEAGQITLYNKNFNVNNTFRLIYESFNSQLKTLNKPIELKLVKGLSEDSATIHADKLRIEQVVSNFLSNAVKFTNEGSIEFGYFIKENNISFYVKDTGIGMSADELKIIFDRFRQASTSYNKMYGGTGLGLSISKGLSDIMDGTIHVESVKNVGSTFYFTIPFKPGFKGDDKMPSVTTDFEYNWENKILLIAEDEEANYSLLENIIRPTQAKILRAHNGKEAVETCINNKDIDLVLMDIKMPEMNGLEATRKIKKVRKNLPIIAQTAYAMSADEENCIDAGCDDYFSKPLSIDALLNKIHTQLQKHSKIKGQFIDNE